MGIPNLRCGKCGTYQNCWHSFEAEGEREPSFRGVLNLKNGLETLDAGKCLGCLRNDFDAPSWREETVDHCWEQPCCCCVHSFSLSSFFRACPSSLRDIASCHFSLVLWQERGAARGEHRVWGPGAQRLSSIILTPPLQSQTLSGSLHRTVPEESPAGVSSTV